MEKIEVAVRLRPLLNSGAETNQGYSHLLSRDETDFLDESDNQHVIFRSDMSAAASDIWRIEPDRTTLRLVSPAMQAHQLELVQSALHQGSSFINGSHSHNKSLGNKMCSSGTLSRQTSMGKLTGSQTRINGSREHNNREDNKSITNMRPPY